MTALVAFEFDHIVANAYYLSSGLLLVTVDPDAVAASGQAALATTVTLPAVLATVLPVTLGNVVGGGLLVALVYWFVYLRAGRARSG